ncbi:DUF455 domain protein [Daldinia sp. FL1419]|nr:DUF455 domain protein [Daldinia sp. FL1419]
MQGFNMGRYVPPDVEGTTTGNKLHKKRPPGFSASGQTVRFEMPFAIWCAHCPKPTLIAQGVRFNAQKRKVGAYYTTPIYSFRISHASCGGSIEIRTDPEHTTYAVTEGGRKRDTGTPDPLAEQISTEKEREKLRADAFAKLEKTIGDRKAFEEAKEHIEQLEQDSARFWQDPYEQNRRLRAEFRAERKEREKDAATTENLRERMSLGIELLPANPEDAARAALVDFRPSETAGGEMGRKALAKPLFPASTGSGGGDGASTKDEKKKKRTKNKKLKSEAAAAQMRDNLVSEIVGNTRVAQDPFLSLDRHNGDSNKGPVRIAGIKRKRLESGPEPESNLQAHEEPQLPKKKDAELEEKGKGTISLVEYDSD